eukprot:1161097-Pelagomonas_calceolata.AAC.11
MLRDKLEERIGNNVTCVPFWNGRAFVWLCFYAGSYAEKIYTSWVHFTWRLARYYYHFLVLSEKLTGRADSLSVQAKLFVQEVLDAYPVLNSPHLCIAAVSTFLLGPVLLCVMLCRRKHAALQNSLPCLVSGVHWIINRSSTAVDVNRIDRSSSVA